MALLSQYYKMIIGPEHKQCAKALQLRFMDHG